MDRRTAIAEAAIEVLATKGSRGLTHRAVDAAAGLPAGSTSNVFRTRAALVEGIVDRLAERDRLAMTTPPSPRPGAPDPGDPIALADMIVGHVMSLVTPPTDRATRARMVLALEDEIDMSAQHDGLLTTFAPVLAGLGDPDPMRTLRAVSDYLEGAIFHALALSSRPIVREESVAAVLALLPPHVLRRSEGARGDR